ncbi:hypothetical protein BBJ28_00018793 [Nothophytophthora sp. Chile5]|nr:hypothetical protein BBJ28_00018793 [Nothophytophthora sp. Chile5]
MLCLDFSRCTAPNTITTMSTKRTVYLSSRKSQLAMAQTTTVIAMLKSHFPDIDFVVGQEDTVGDQVLDRHLSDLGTSTATRSAAEINRLSDISRIAAAP